MNINDKFITIRTLTSKDVPFGMMLTKNEGWIHLPSDWDRLIACEPGGCFVAQYHGQDAGTATVTGYEKRFGWVGMVLVRDDMRRKGIGTAMLIHGLKYLEDQGIASVNLYATPTGQKLYENIGFATEYFIERRQGVGERMDMSGVIPFVSDLMERLCHYDAPIFGADRSRVLRRLAELPDAHTGVHINDFGKIQGYIMARKVCNCHYIGPWVADDADIGRTLWLWALSQIPGEPFYVDVCLANPDVDDIVPKSLFPVERQLIRMVRGENRYPGQPESVFAISGPEMG